MIDPRLPDCGAIRPALAKLAQHGGAILIAIQHDPACMNYCSVTHGWFHKDEVKALRRALSNAKRKREAQSIK